MVRHMSKAYWVDFKSHLHKSGCIEAPSAKVAGELADLKYGKVANVSRLPHCAEPRLIVDVDAQRPSYCHTPNYCKGKFFCQSHPSCVLASLVGLEPDKAREALDSEMSNEGV